jgi:hypothetical protein
VNADIVHYIVEGVMSGVLAYIAFRKAPGERAKDESTAIKEYAQGARIKGEENLRLEGVIRDLEARLNIVERKRYRITMEFEVGDPPVPGEVLIEPVIPHANPVQIPMRKKKV